MKLPVHNNPQGQAAKSPYNFVPLPETIVTLDPDRDLPDQDRYDPNRHTGYIDCTVTTESPTFVRAPLTPEEFRQQEAGEERTPWREQTRNKPDFFYTDPAKSPRIPGSSLRGMLRQLVEIVGYGKMEFVSDQKLVYRAVGDTTSHGDEYRKRIMRYDGEATNKAGKRTKQYTPLVRAGYIQERHGNFTIQPAREIGGVTFARIRFDDIPPRLEPVPGCKNARTIYFQAGPYDYQDVRGGFLRIKAAKVLRASAQEGPGLLRGALAKSGEMASKRSEAVIFPLDETSKAIEISSDLIRSYRDQLSQEQKALLGDKGVLQNGQPVFYLMEKNQLVFFGHTMMMRLPYLRSPKDYIPKELREEANLDLAEALFGYTKKGGEGKARAYAGRVFVGDAVLEAGQSDIWLRPEPVITPRILGGPKPTTFQHYLVQKNPDPQEKGRTRDGSPKLVKELSDYTASTPATTALRGHKLFWHKGNVAPKEIEEAEEKLLDSRGRENEHDTQHTQIRPVAAGVTFRARIHFENLSAEELGALLWALTLPGRPGQEYRHSIGMGKPYGMGAIKLDAALVLDDRKKRYGSLFDGTAWQEGHTPASERISEFIGAFDRWVRHGIGANDCASLAEVERIQMLLKLLEWPGPDKELTRYLEIERQDPNFKRGKINEYKGRPVLPDPLHIAGGGGRAPTSTATSGQQHRSTTTRPQSEQRPAPIAPRGAPEVKPVPTPEPAAKADLKLSHPTSIAEVKPGMHLEGKVVRVEISRLVVEILGEEASLVRDNIVPPIRDEYDLEARFPAGKIIRVLVRNRNKQGRLQLTMRIN